VGFAYPDSFQSRYLYAAFPDASGTAGQAILLRLIRTQVIGTERRYGAQFRIDLTG
jgi:hypothetical protein